MEVIDDMESKELFEKYPPLILLNTVAKSKGMATKLISEESASWNIAIRFNDNGTNRILLRKR
ncbi:MAG: hypothetical protein INQ03_09095 [Candidatus Heimdallarchaeota archaeon]|nr:hypothetical protein [Candidatus Heimdallarchaeota archaeon]